MKPRGIPLAQIDSNTEGDPKFTRLRMLAGERYYSAFGCYMSLVLRSWATASNDIDSDHVGLMDQADLAMLKTVGLLDAEGAVPGAVWRHWVGTVLEDLEAHRDQLASIASAGGKARAAAGLRDAHGWFLPDGPADIQPVPLDNPADIQPSVQRSSRHTLSTLSSSSLSSTIESSLPRAGAREDAAFETYASLVNVPSTNASKWIDELVAEFGDERTAEAIGSAGMAGPTSILKRAKAALVRGARAADRREAEDEKRRLEQKRKPDPLTAEYRAAIKANYGGDRT